MMALDNRREFCQRVILDHYKKPVHKGRTNPVHRCQRGQTPYCGDIIELTIKLDRTNNIIEDIKFEGEGCTIAIASADLMAGALRGKSTDEALEMVQRFQKMMKGEGGFPEQSKQLSKLNVMQAVTHPLRIKCANLSWYTLKSALTSSSEILLTSKLLGDKKEDA